MKQLEIVLLVLVLSLGTFMGSGWAASHSGGKSAKPLFGYTPPMRGAPTTRIGTGTRGGPMDGMERKGDGDNPFAEKKALGIALLAPDHTGLTMSQTPTLYWYITAPSPGPILLQIGSQRQVFPILENYLPAVSKAGFYELKLSDLSFKLQEDLDYKIRITAVNQQKRPIRGVHSTAIIRYTGDRPKLRAGLQGKSRLQQAEYLANQSIWYDMMDRLSQEIDHTGSSEAHSQRAFLLEQVGISTNN